MLDTPVWDVRRLISDKFRAMRHVTDPRVADRLRTEVRTMSRIVRFAFRRVQCSTMSRLGGDFLTLHRHQGFVGIARSCFTFRRIQYRTISRLFTSLFDVFNARRRLAGGFF